jgi:WD40 repeat protein
MSRFLRTQIQSDRSHQLDSSKTSLVRNSLYENSYRSFFGDDVFISHSRIDGINYAKNLARLLQKNYRFMCFADFYWTEVGEKLPAFLIKKLKRSTMLVVVITPGAVESSDNIKSEIEIFKTTGRPICVVDINSSYRREDWVELHGINNIKDFAATPTSTKTKSGPSMLVLKSIRESFTYRTKYSQQRRSAFISAGFLILSFLSITVAIGASVYASKSLSEASLAKRERDSANAEREVARKERDQVNKELLASQIKLHDSETDLSETRTNLKQVADDKQKAEADLQIAVKTRDLADELARTSEIKRREAVAGTVEAQNAARIAKEDEVRAKADTLQARNEATIAKDEANLANREAEKSNKAAKENKTKELGHQASLLSLRPDQRLPALKVAIEATEQSLDMGHSFNALPDEVKKGLADSVVSMDFARPLENEGGWIDGDKVKISTDGKLIFGTIKNYKTAQETNVIWAVENPGKYYMLGSQRFDTGHLVFDNGLDDIDFSRDGKWLVMTNENKIELWEITKRNNEYDFQKTDEITSDAHWFGLSRNVLVAVNSDGSKIVTTSGDGNNAPARVLVRKDKRLMISDRPLLPSFAKFGDFIEIGFSPSDELIVDYWTDKKREKHDIYNSTAGKLLAHGDKDLYLHSIADSGDLILERRFGINHKSEFFLQNSKEKRAISAVPEDGNTLSVAYVEGKILRIGDFAGTFCLMDSDVLPNAFVINNPAISRYSELPKFSFLSNKNRLAFWGTHDLGYTIKQGEKWSVYPPFNTKNNPPEKFENFNFSTEMPSDYVFNLSRQRIQMVNLNADTKAQCSQMGLGGLGFSDRIFLLGNRYPAFLDSDYLLSVFDPLTCSLIRSVQLKGPNFRSTNIESESQDILNLDTLSAPNETSLMGVFHPFKMEGPGEYFLGIWDLDKIDHDNSQTNNSPRVYALSDEWLSGVVLSPKAVTPTVFAVQGKGAVIFKLEEKKIRRIELEEDSGPVGSLGHSVDFSDSGSLIGALSREGTIRVWNAANGKRVLTLTTPELMNKVDKYYVTSLRFSPDEKSIAVLGSDSRVRFYPVLIEDFYKMAKVMLGGK